MNKLCIMYYPSDVLLRTFRECHQPGHSYNDFLLRCLNKGLPNCTWLPSIYTIILVVLLGKPIYERTHKVKIIYVTARA